MFKLQSATIWLTHFGFLTETAYFEENYTDFCFGNKQSGKHYYFWLADKNSII